MGNRSFQLAEGIALVASKETWIEGSAVQQLERAARLPGMCAVAGMPDLHPGRGYPIGFAAFSEGHVYPALVGNDIGCGMALWQTDLPAARPPLDKWIKRLGSIDEPLDESWAERIADFRLPPTAHDRSLGTIGGGNHFAELQALDEVFDAAALERVGGLDRMREHLVLLVHSGSRGLGEEILSGEVAACGHQGITQTDPRAAHYLERHDHAVRFAIANRQLVAQRMLEGLRSEGHRRLDVTHNFVERARFGERTGWLHRKGATPADRGPVVIPGSRGDFSYLVEPLTHDPHDPHDPDVSGDFALRSLAHGAGRKWTRSESKDRLVRRFDVRQLERTPLGSRVICDDRQLLYEEAPQAYKDIDSVVGALRDAGLVRLLARLRPVLTYKTRGKVER
jgi:release factor H-coupled RctB family protein